MLDTRLFSLTKDRFKAIYAVAHFGKSLFWHASEILFAFFLTEACGLPADRMGVILALSLAVNAFGDMLIGKRLAGHVRDTASASRMQFAGGIASTLTFLAFAMTGLLPASWRLWAALVSLVAFRLAYPFYDVPQNAILAYETHTETERSRLAALRFVFSGLANVFVVAAFVPLLQGHAGRSSAERFGLLALILAAAAVTSAAGLFVMGRNRPDKKPLPKTQIQVPRIETVANKGLWSLMLASLVLSLGTSVFSRLEPYYASFALTSWFSSASLLICIALGNLVSQPIWALIAERTSLKRVQWSASLTLIAGALLFALVSRSGAAGAGGSGFIYGFGAGGVMMVLWCYLARLCDATPERTTRLFGLFTFFSKIGLALSVLGLGVIMHSFDYRAAAGQLTMMMAAAPIAGAIICLMLLCWPGASAVKQRLQR